MRFIAAACFALVATSGPALAQKADECLPYLAVSKFMSLMKEGEEPEKAFERSMSKSLTEPRVVQPGSMLNSKGGICQRRLSRRPAVVVEVVLIHINRLVKACLSCSGIDAYLLSFVAVATNDAAAGQ